MVRVGFQEALGDDQGEKSQGEERLGDSFSGGGFHYGAQPVINRFPCQALPHSSFRIPNVYGVEITTLSVIVGHAVSRKIHSRGHSEVAGNEGGEDRDDTVCSKGDFACSDGAPPASHGC